MARFLFVSWGGAGNQTPVSGLAATLAVRGHDITVAGYPDNGGLPDGFAFMGPVFEPPREPRWTPPWAAGDHRPLVVASFPRDRHGTRAAASGGPGTPWRTAGTVC
ncbi:hypothetical protein E1281_18520 [Actinomadura sp. KC345]|uniref:hypothetical protein n=1 Tax=Actinomadura sp. KC345 TaxID=2530371 RepID=UPI001046F4C8|nr:hypothetical protein [Actinomadura sp. KC345]TDC52876.1 hypothetical protein E1281_18520 [Actinomadura sp. KC345]